MKKTSNTSGIIYWGIGVAISALMLCGFYDPASEDEENTALLVAFMFLTWTSMFCIAHIVQLINNEPDSIPDGERFAGFLAGTCAGVCVLILSYIIWGVNIPSLTAIYLLSMLVAGMVTYTIAGAKVEAGSDTCE